MIEYKCRFCAADMESPEGVAGKMDICPTCGKVQAVPGRPIPLDPAQSLPQSGPVGGADGVQPNATGADNRPPDQPQAPAGPARTQAKSKEMLIACIAMTVLLIVACVGVVWWIWGRSHSPEAGTLAPGVQTAGGRLEEWGIRFNPPGNWTRWTGDKEQKGVVMLQSQMDGTGRKVLSAAVWVPPEERAAMIVGLYSDASVGSLRSLLADEKAKMEQEQRTGDVTAIHELAMTSIGGVDAVKSDVERRNGGRGVCYYFQAGPNVACTILVVQRASEFGPYHEQLRAALANLSIDSSLAGGGGPRKVERQPAAPRADDDGSSPGFSKWERKVLPWVFAIMCAGICGGAAKAKAKGKK